RRRTEESLRLSEAKYRATLGSLPDAVLVLDVTGVIRECHTEDACALFGRPERAPGGRLQDMLPTEAGARLDRWLAGDHRVRDSIAVEYSVQAGAALHEYEARLVHSRTNQILSVVRNITERKRCERALRDREAAMRESARGEYSLAGRL